MRSRLRWLLALGALAALALTVSSCGGDDDGGGGGESAVPSEFAAPLAAPDNAQKGGHLKVLANGDVDYMDPGAAYYQFSYMVMQAGHRTLLSWDPDDLNTPTPDGAEDQPEVSDDGLRVTFTIRKGMKFAPPVDREITAADYEYAIERSVLPGVANGYVSGYFSDVVGFEAVRPTGRASRRSTTARSRSSSTSRPRMRSSRR
jgi:peptide/nickel transport system substrate-binding protein